MLGAVRRVIGIDDFTPDHQIQIDRKMVGYYECEWGSDFLFVSRP